MLEFLWEPAIAAEGKLPASERKRRQARDRGAVAVSPLPAQAAALAWLGGVAAVGLGWAGWRLSELASTLLDVSRGPMAPDRALVASAEAALPVLATVLAVPLLAVAAGVAQVGARWTLGASASGGEGEGADLGAHLSQVLSFGRAAVAALTFSSVVLAAAWAGGALSPSALLRVSGAPLDFQVAVLGESLRDALLAAAAALLAVGCVDWVVRRRRFELAIAMTPEEVRREALEDDGRPEARQRREARARELLAGGAPEVALLDGLGGLVLVGRPGGKGAPRVLARTPPPEGLRMAETLRSRGVPTVLAPGVAARLLAVPPGAAVPSSVEDGLAEVYRSAGLGARAAEGDDAS